MTEETPDLHMFYIGDSDFVVAASIDDAWAVWEETTGCKRDDEDDYDCVQLPDERVLPCSVDAEGEPCEHGEGTVARLTAAEWAARLGRCFAFSENY